MGARHIEQGLLVTSQADLGSTAASPCFRDASEMHVTGSYAML